jgi:hypothetical protein
MDQATQNPGMAQAVQAAMDRRGMGPGATQAGQGQLTQASGGAPMQNPLPQPTAPSDLNKASAPQGAAPSQPEKYMPKNQQDMIVMALIEQLKNTHKLEMEKTKIDQPSAGVMPVAQTQPPAAPPAPPMGQPPMGGGAPMCPVCHGQGCAVCGQGGGGDLFPVPDAPKRDAFSLGMPSLATSQKQGGYPF